MAEIILKTNEPEKATGILFEALEKESQRIQYSLSLAIKRLKRFEKKYDVSSEKFFAEWGAEDLENKDMEYVEWAGEYQLSIKLNESLSAIKSIENVTQ